jgi:hypothetical protein
MKIFVKLFTGSLLLSIMLCQACEAQYYYQDLVVTRQSANRWKLYRDNNLKTVILSSFEHDGSPSEGFQCDQTINKDHSVITTHTHSSGTPESWLIASFSPDGMPVRTLDTSDTYRSASEYQYDGAGRLMVLTNTSLETDNQLKEVEQHIWQYDEKGMPSRMLKIRNGADTTFIRFVTDDKGHVAEEHSTRNQSELPVIFYYYDANDRLTDIVRFNDKAQRLLPDFVFDYNDNSVLPASMLVIREGGKDYQKWVYEYDAKGLKVKESCYNRQKQLSGRIEYQYK